MGNRPTHKVLSVSERQDGTGSKPFFTRIGSAWPIKNGAGLAIELDALPIGSRIVVMEFDKTDLKPRDDTAGDLGEPDTAPPPKSKK